MNSNTRDNGDKPLISIGSKYKYQKVLGFSVTEGSGSTEPGVTYLSHYPNNNGNASIFPTISFNVIGRYFSAFNTLNNHNIMWQSGLTLERNWVTYGGYFILANTVELGVGIPDEKLLLCHGISEISKYKKILFR